MVGLVFIETLHLTPLQWAALGLNAAGWGWRFLCSDHWEFTAGLTLSGLWFAFWDCPLMDDQTTDNLDNSVYLAALRMERTFEPGNVGRLSVVVSAMGIWASSTPFSSSPVVDQIHEERTKEILISGNADITEESMHNSSIPDLEMETYWTQSRQGTPFLSVSDMVPPLDMARTCFPIRDPDRVWKY